MENIISPYKSVLTIAGSDSGGCAGIQADIKSISACGAYAASVITATTAQNTQGVYDIHPIPISHIEKQLDAVLADIDFGAIKIGMLHSSDVIHAIETMLTSHNVKNIVLDPVMVATSGAKLIETEAIARLKEFIPRARLITPNVCEAELLIEHTINLENIEISAKEIGQAYNTSVLLKGGHLESPSHEIVDVLYDHESGRTLAIKNPKIKTINTHGTGCSLSSSIATFLSLGCGLETATKKGCHYINRAIDHGKNRRLGKGNGPINHFDLK